MFRELIGKSCFILCMISANAQNLVPNPGFEEISGCPETHSLIENAVPWRPGNFGSPDLFNRCAIRNQRMEIVCVVYIITPHLIIMGSENIL